MKLLFVSLLIIISIQGVKAELIEVGLDLGTEYPIYYDLAEGEELPISKNGTVNYAELYYDRIYAKSYWRLFLLDSVGFELRSDTLEGDTKSIGWIKEIERQFGSFRLERDTFYESISFTPYFIHFDSIINNYELLGFTNEMGNMVSFTNRPIITLSDVQANDRSFSYPQPSVLTDGNVTVLEFDVEQILPSSLIVYGTSGKIYKKEVISAESSKVEIKHEALPKGLYFITLTYPDGGFQTIQLKK